MGSSPVTHSSGSFCGLRWLRGASIFHEGFELRVRPVFRPGTVERAPAFDLIALPLDHGPPTLGWRLEEPEGRRRMLPERLDALGVRGFDVGRLQREGAVRVGGRLVTLEEVSQLRRGQRFAFLMDTRPCEAAVELARDSDLLVCECTYGANEENCRLVRASHRGPSGPHRSGGRRSPAGPHSLLAAIPRRPGAARGGTADLRRRRGCSGT